MLSDRLSPDWPIEFALQYFGRPREFLQRVVGINGRVLLCREYERVGDQLYHMPEFAIRQEWIYGRCGRRNLIFQKVSPEFFEHYIAGGMLFDFGCGTAEPERKLWIDRGQPTILMDLAGPNFEYTKAKYKGYNVEYRTVGTALPDSYDGLICLDVLEHVPNPLELWASLWSRLKPGGLASVWFDTSNGSGHLESSMQQYAEWVRITNAQSGLVKRRRGCDLLYKPTGKKWWWPW